MIEDIKRQLLDSLKVLDNFLDDQENLHAVEEAARIMIDCINNGGKIIACGNGGSMSDAMHFASELTGRYKSSRRSLPAIAISDSGHISCVANDYGYENVFSKYIEAHGRPGDVFLALSTSGNSPNVIRACGEALSKDMHVVSITGDMQSGIKNDITRVAALSNVRIYVPHYGSADKIQELTIIIIHVLVEQIEKGVKL